MTSQIDDVLTPMEREVLAAYRSSKSSSLRTPIRLSIQYAVAGALLLGGSHQMNKPWLGALLVYSLLVVVLLVRLLVARKIVGVMPGIIEKYEDRIDELSNKDESGNADDAGRKI